MMSLLSLNLLHSLNLGIKGPSLHHHIIHGVASDPNKSDGLEKRSDGTISDIGTVVLDNLQIAILVEGGSEQRGHALDTPDNSVSGRHFIGLND